MTVVLLCRLLGIRGTWSWWGEVTRREETGRVQDLDIAAGDLNKAFRYKVSRDRLVAVLHHRYDNVRVLEECLAEAVIPSRVVLQIRSWCGVVADWDLLQLWRTWVWLANQELPRSPVQVLSELVTGEIWLRTNGIATKRRAIEHVWTLVLTHHQHVLILHHLIHVFSNCPFLHPTSHDRKWSNGTVLFQISKIDWEYQQAMLATSFQLHCLRHLFVIPSRCSGALHQHKQWLFLRLPTEILWDLWGTSAWT